jgi:hypothetical protein
VLFPAAAALLVAFAPPPTPAPSADAAPARPRTHLLVADVLRVDARRRAVQVKTGDTPPVEMQILTDVKTRVTSGGRTARFEDLKAGDRVAVSCTDDAAGAHTARLVVIRPRPPASPTPAS